MPLEILSGSTHGRPITMVHSGPGVWGCLALALLPGCKQDAGSSPVPQVPEVGIVVATAQDVPDEPEFIGQSESSRPVEIRSQVTGILKAWFFKEGREVKKAIVSTRSIRCPFMPRC